MITPLVLPSRSSTGAVMALWRFFTLMNAFSIMPAISG
jgi:hypothetical protein